MSPDFFSSCERLDAAVDELLLVARQLVAVEARVEIVDDQRVDGVDGEPLQRLRVGAHDAVVGVVEIDLEVQSAESRARGRRSRGPSAGAASARPWW